MGAATPERGGDPKHHRSGSHFYRQDKVCRWRTFDQIIFSSSLLSAIGWRLREDLVNVIDLDRYTELVVGTDMNFDHLPVIGVIEKAV